MHTFYQLGEKYAFSPLFYPLSIIFFPQPVIWSVLKFISSVLKFISSVLKFISSETDVASNTLLSQCSPYFTPSSTLQPLFSVTPPPSKYDE